MFILTCIIYQLLVVNLIFSNIENSDQTFLTLFCQHLATSERTCRQWLLPANGDNQRVGFLCDKLRALFDDISLDAH